MLDEVKTGEHLIFPFARSLEIDHDPVVLKLFEEKPVVRARLHDGNEVWVALSYESVQRVPTDRTFSRSAALDPDAPTTAPRRTVGRCRIKSRA